MAILRDGAIVATRVQGPVTLETNFRLASVTKQFTAAAVAVLVRRGLMDYDAPDARGITIRHLLNHTSGLADYEDLLAPGRTEQVHDDEVAALTAAAPLLFAPGTRFRYSNSGYVLLGVLIERAANVPLERFFEEELFALHGMHGTTLGPAKNRACGNPRDQSVTSATRGDGGVYSNVLDLARWMARPPAIGDTVPADVPDTRYGFGWYVRGERVWHCGDTAGFRSTIFREGGRTVIALTNCE
jgi:CubicO group peptidase (beta-lactamase class C family)